MIDLVTITNSLRETLRVDLRDTNPSHGLFISEIEGLGTVKANIRMSENATSHGGKYNSSRAESRDIVFHFLYVDGYIDGKYVSAEEARMKTYQFLPLGEPVELSFYTDYVSDKSVLRGARIEGYVESNDPDIFSEPLAGSTITVKCPSPWFYIPNAQGKVVETFSNLESEFEFPEESYSGAYNNTENDPEYGFLEFEPVEQDIIEKDDAHPTRGGTKVFTSLNTNETHDVIYNGEVETGMLITISANGRFRNPTIYNVKTGKQMTINTDIIEKMLDPSYDPETTTPQNRNIDAGDEIRISTYQNSKRVRFYQEGVEKFNAINAIDPNEKNFDWLTLRPGLNQFAYSCTEGDLNIDIILETTVYLQGV